MRLIGILLVAWLLFCILLAADAFGGTVWHVNRATGDDTYAGNSPSQPFKTIKRAAELSTLAAGDTVRIYTGRYTEAIKLRSKTGTSTNPIVFIEADAQACTVQVANLVSPFVADTALSVKSCQYVEFHKITFYGNYFPTHISGSSYILFKQCVWDQSDRAWTGGVSTGIPNSQSYNIKLGTNSYISFVLDTLIGQTKAGYAVPTYAGIRTKDGANYRLLVDRCHFIGWFHWGVALVNNDNQYVVVGCTSDSAHGFANFTAPGPGAESWPGRGLFAWNRISNHQLKVYPNEFKNADGHLGGFAQLGADSIISRYNRMAQRVVRAGPTNAAGSSGSGTQYGSIFSPQSVAYGNALLGARTYNNTIWCRIGYGDYFSSGLGIEAISPGSIGDDKYLNNIIIGGYLYGLDFKQSTLASVDAYTNFSDGNMVWSGGSKAPNDIVRYLGVSSIDSSISWFMANKTSRFGPNNKWSYPTAIDSDSYGSQGGTFAPSIGSNVIDAGRWLAVVTATGTTSGKTWAKLDDALWFFDGWGLIPADSIRVGAKDFELERQGQDTLYFKRYDPVSVGDSVTVLSSWDGWGYQRNLNGTRPDIGAIEYGGTPTIPPSGTLTASSTEITGPTSIKFTWTTSGTIDSLFFEGVKQDSLNDDTTFTVSASNYYDLEAYWNGGIPVTLASVSITVGSTPVTNSVSNGSFERSTGWSYYDNGGTQNAYARQTSVVQESTYAARIVLDDTLGTNNQLFTSSSQYLNIENGKTYTLDFYARCAGTSKDSMRVRILDYTTPYTVYNGSPKFTFADTGWVYCSETFTASNTDASSELQFLFYVTSIAPYAHGTDTIYIDAIRLYEIAPPDAPTLTTPLNDQGMDSSRAIFQWTPYGTVASHIQIDDDRSMASPTVQDSTVAVNSYLAAGLTKGTEFFWRVRIKSSAGWSDWSGIDSMLVNNAAPDSAPLLLTPTSYQINVSVRPSLDWDMVAGASQFIYQIATDTGFTALTIYDSIGTTTPTWAFNDLAYSTTYYWRVRAANSSGYGPWAIRQSFTTGSRIGLATNKRARVRR